MAASVFLLPNLSVTNRLGRHMQVEKYDDYERPSEVRLLLRVALAGWAVGGGGNLTLEIQLI